MKLKSSQSHFPKLYPILDAGLLTTLGCDMAAFAMQLRAAGVELLQYRNKQGSDRQILQGAAILRGVFANTGTSLILNDRADLLNQSGFDGIHVGQHDLSPAVARRIIGADAIVGVSTHSLEQIAAADATDCDYIAYGPIFATSSKANPDPVVGLHGLRAARLETNKPLVAIGGITRQNCRSVLEAGADSVAVISDLFPLDTAITAQQIAEEFLALLTA